MPPVDGVDITAGTGTKILTDDTGAGGHAQVVKLAISTDGSGTLIPADATNGMLVNLGTNNDVTVTGTVAVTQSGTWDEIGINDSGNSITVDAPVGTPVFVRLSDGTAAITGTAADGLLVNLGTNNDVTVTGTVTVGSITAGDNNIGNVDVVTLPALPAGTNNIGDVDVLTVPAPLNVTGTGTEAAALRVTIASDSTGLLSVDDNSGSLTVDAPVGTPVFVRLSDGVSPISTLPVSLASVPSHAVTNAGTFATQVDGAALTALQLIDDPVQVLGTDVFTEGASKGITIGAVRRDADTTLVNATNEFGPLQMDANGRLKVEAFSGETLPVSLTSTTVTGTVTVAGTVTANLAAGTNNIGDVDILSIAAGDNNIGNVDIVTVPAPLSTTGGGTEATALRVTIANDSTGVVSIDDNGGSLTVDGTVTASLASGTNNIGDVDVLTVPAPLSTTGGGTEAAALRVTLANDSTGLVSVDDNGGSLTVDGTVTANLAAGTNNIGDVDVLTVPAPLSTTGGGTEATALRVTIANDSTGLLPVVANRDQITIDVTSGGLTTATTAYTAGDQVGTIFALASAAKTSGGTGAVTGVRLMDETDIIGPFDVVFFDSSVTLASDNAAFAISDADAAKVIGLVQLGGAYDIGNNRIAQAFNLAIPYTLSGSSNLYAALITRAGHTFFGAATSLKLRVMVERYS